MPTPLHRLTAKTKAVSRQVLRLSSRLPELSPPKAPNSRSQTIELDYLYSPVPIDDSIASDPITSSNTVGISGDILPYGIQAVYGGEDITEWGNFAEGTTVFVIDSGVSDGTNDLNLNEEWSRSWVDDEPFVDESGHGTHVAGTIAAKNNGEGVVGAAPGADVVALKVFERNGTASSGDIIEAVEYATEIIVANDMQDSAVINMSLGGPRNPALDAAVRDAADQGVVVVIAAGNSGRDVDRYSPARVGDHENVYVVSAVNEDLKMPSWSNSDNPENGDDVDFAAPGVRVYSYYRDDELAYLSGTSMSAPHVAGLLLTEGVQEGDEVTPNRRDYPDPFALAIIDINKDGFVDNLDNYRVYSNRQAIDITDNRGRPYSDSSSQNWDALVAVEADNGFLVLVEGTARKEGKYYAAEINSNGIFTGGSGWKTTDNAVALGWEERFGVELGATDQFTSNIA